MSLRPEDAMSRPLSSTCGPANNILLNITVPKRTGRKRKRGSSDEFTFHSSTDSEQSNAAQLRRKLQDNVGRYEVKPVGRVGRTHVFRGILTQYNLDR